MDLSKLSLAELKTLLGQIPKEIDRRQKEEKAKLVKELEAKAAALGFSLAELVGQNGRKAQAPMAIKYRHPKNADLAWSGRGRQPRWVAEFVSNGGSLEQLQA